MWNRFHNDCKITRTKLEEDCKTLKNSGAPTTAKEIGLEPKI